MSEALTRGQVENKLRWCGIWGADQVQWKKELLDTDAILRAQLQAQAERVEKAEHALSEAGIPQTFQEVRTAWSGMVERDEKIADLTAKLEAQSVTYQDNLTEIQLLKDQLQREELKHNSTIDAANSAQIYIEALEANIRKPCEIYPGLRLLTREDGIWLCFSGEGVTGKKGMVHLGNHFGYDPVVGPAVREWLQRMKRWEGGGVSTHVL